MSLLIYHFLKLPPITFSTYVIRFGPWEHFSGFCCCKVGFFTFNFVLSGTNMQTFLSLIVGWFGMTPKI